MVERPNRISFHLTSRQVNLWLTVGLFVTGLVSWAVGSGWVRWWTFAHSVLGLLLLVLALGRGGCSRRFR